MNSPHSRSQRSAGRIVRLAMVAILFGLSSSIVAADNAQAPYRGKLFFFGNVKPDGVSVIESTNLDGSGLETVLSLPNENISLGRVSPDGRLLAFSSSPKEAKRSDETRLSILSADRKVTKLPEPGLTMTCWAPDSKRVVAMRGSTGKRESLIVDAASGKTTLVEAAKGDVVDDWAPDGSLSLIAENMGKIFTRPDGERYPLRGLYAATLAGARQKALAAESNRDFIWSRFSPDGTKVAYYKRSYPGIRSEEFCMVADRDGSNPKELVNFSTFEEAMEYRASGSPCWTPDGKTIIWRIEKRRERSDDGPTFELIYIPADGSKPTTRLLGEKPSERRDWWGHIDCR